MYDKIFEILKWGGRLLTVCFGKSTTGYGSGNKIEPDTFTQIPSGNLKNRGVTHFFDEASVKEILKEVGFKKIQINNMLYTDNGNKVEQIITIAEKLKA